MSRRAGNSEKVVGVGLACLDQLILWRDMQAPLVGNKILDFQVQGGGMVGTAMVAVAHHQSTLRAARQAQRLGVPVVADLGGIGENTPALLAHVEYAIISERCAQRVAGGDDYRAACQAMRSMGPEHVVVTLGEKGLVYLDGERLAEMPAFPVEVVDTTGAGDTFHGAFCYGLVQGFPFLKNLQFASAAAAMKCRQMGGRAGIPGRDEVVGFLIERGVAWP